MTPLAELLVHEREKRGMTTEEFSHFIGTTRKLYNLIVWHDHKPKESTVAKFYEALGINGSYEDKSLCEKCFNLINGECDVFRVPELAMNGSDGLCRGFSREPVPCAECGGMINAMHDPWTRDACGNIVCFLGDDSPSAGNSLEDVGPLARKHIKELGYV